jgi:Serine phosphatase RsbU, regulator of sigma subunit
MRINISRDFIKENKSYLFLFIVFILSCIFFVLAILLQKEFGILINTDTYLAWHNIFESAAILVSFSIFMVSYYTYDLTNRLRTALFGSVFLAVGLIDFFHMLSYKGMPFFFIENTTSNRPTTFWVLARFIAAIAFLILSFVPSEKKAKIDRRVYLFPPVILSIAIFIIVTYIPGFFPAMYIEGAGLTNAKRDIEYFIILLLILSAIKFLYDYIIKKDLLAVLICGSLILSVFSEVAFVSYSQVYDIFNYIGHIYKVLSYYLLFRVIFVRNVQQPYIELSGAQTKLRNYADSLDKIVDQRTMQLKRINKRLMDDLEYARDIQKAMLPAVIPDIQNITFNSMYYPAERLSGDFYDIYKLDDQHFSFYICDVSGHGVPAAMLTVFLKQCIETRREADMNSGSISFPSKVLNSIFDSFNNTNFKDEVYMVLVYAIYNIKTRKLIYCSAGMNIAPLVIKKDGSIMEIAVKGLPICKVKDIYDVEYIDMYIELQVGDKLLFYTDGLIDAKNVENKPYTAERLYELLNKKSNNSGMDLLEDIKYDLYNFINGKKIIDDITFFIIDIIM